MKKAFLTVFISCVMSMAAWADFATTPYIAGEFNGWDPGALPMTETSPGSGIWTYTISGLDPYQAQAFKITQGNWDSNWPPENSWYTADASGQVTVTFNANSVVSDGWLPAQYRLTLDTDPGSWSLVGNYNGWNNADPTQLMTPLGGGIYVISQTWAPGDYEFKPTQTGTWDAIGPTRGRCKDADNYYLSLTLSTEVTVYVDAYTGTMGFAGEVELDTLPHDPLPDNFDTEVPVGTAELSWAVAVDPNGVVDPNLVSHDLYIAYVGLDDPNDPNLMDAFVANVPQGWSGNPPRESYTLGSDLVYDARYQWRVDMVYDDATILEGNVWTFTTQLSTPSVTDPDYQVVDTGGTAIFEVTATSVSTPSYQWYKYVDGISDTLLTNGGDISGADSNSLSIANAELVDEGGYYCIVNNDSGVPAQSAQGLLGIRRLLAKWDFESSSYQSTVAGSPVSYLYNDPNFAVAGGISGDGMEFDNDPDSEDILYTDPDQVSYFDICRKSITVGCWINSSFAAQWGPMVARNGEAFETTDGGWQLRHRGDTLDRICFTTRGTGNDDGRASNKTVYDGNWHYVAATYDGTEKKVYIDGVVTRVYNGDDGSIASESQAAGGLMNPTPSPVSLAGRVKGESGDLVFEGYSVTPCVLDEVEIYNYALDAATIAQIYADVSGNAVCPAPQQYDLDGDCMINLNEVSLIASEWLIDTSVQPAP